MLHSSLSANASDFVAYPLPCLALLPAPSARQSSAYISIQKQKGIYVEVGLSKVVPAILGGRSWNKGRSRRRRCAVATAGSNQWLDSSSPPICTGAEEQRLMGRRFQGIFTLIPCSFWHKTLTVLHEYYFSWCWAVFEIHADHVSFDDRAHLQSTFIENIPLLEGAV